MEFLHVEKAKSVDYFDQVNRIYTGSFPYSQIRPNKIIRHMLETDQNYHLFVAKHQDSLIGFSLLYIFSELRVGLVDFMAIDKEYRGRSVGSDLFRYTSEACWMLIDNSLGVILEVQRESSTVFDKENIRQKRIIFYRKLGAMIFENVHYLLPNSHGGEPEDMYLMMLPKHKIHFVDKTFVSCVIRAIYRTFYSTYETYQFDCIMAGLSSRIRLI